MGSLFGDVISISALNKLLERFLAINKLKIMTESPAVIGAIKLLSRMLSRMNANYKDPNRQKH